MPYDKRGHVGDIQDAVRDLFARESSQVMLHVDLHSVRGQLSCDRRAPQPIPSLCVCNSEEGLEGSEEPRPEHLFSSCKHRSRKVTSIDYDNANKNADHAGDTPAVQGGVSTWQ